MKEMESAFAHTYHSSRLRQLGRIALAVSAVHNVIPITVESEKVYLKSLYKDNTIVCLYVTWPITPTTKTKNNNPIVHIEVFRHEDSELFYVEKDMEALEHVYTETTPFPRNINAFTGNELELDFIKYVLESVIIKYCGKKSV
ncbi:hypothetical protein [Ewingella americana]|uniref:Uncharacterized protein n=1 Tax=Ewingella americana TaxID=41202 RepID=A0A502GDV3_9GAMM|nr:hypothetical protein [Ewingella americana]TPG59931.1 hypothetical protein EAH77_15300 [Ewingella americana]